MIIQFAAIRFTRNASRNYGNYIRSSFDLKIVNKVCTYRYSKFNMSLVSSKNRLFPSIDPCRHNAEKIKTAEAAFWPRHELPTDSFATDTADVRGGIDFLIQRSSKRAVGRKSS